MKGIELLNLEERDKEQLSHRGECQLSVYFFYHKHQGFGLTRGKCLFGAILGCMACGFYFEHFQTYFVQSGVVYIGSILRTKKC